MSKQLRHLPLVGTLLAIVMAALLLALPSTTKAGIYDASKNTTYKEYWISHKEFTAGCNPDGTPQDPDGNSWYLEPFTLEKCPKTLKFNLPDDFTNAVKVEIYIDLWRNYNTQAARFKLNNHATVYAPPVGYDWSRTPYVAEIPMSDLNVGPNTITFWGDKLYHVHDVAFRIYYTDENPLIAAPGSDVTPPNGDLISIADDNDPVGPGAGGTLTVNNEKLTLKANVSNDAAFVEFHAWYEGYDEDNDGAFRDWHNLGRNNWFPGGTAPQPLGGVIDHIGTVKPNASGEATIVWDTTPIMNQALIKFKIRVVDAAGNVREAAGGESADFKLVRNRPVLGFIIPNFVDTGIHMDGLRPDAFTYQFQMPNTLATFDAAYLIGAYWRNAKFSINGTPPNFANTGDDWTLGFKQFNKNALVAGTNAITYSYSGTGPGSFIERPGPMFLLRRNAGAAGDSQAPAVSAQSPGPGATSIDVKSNVTATISDGLYGVDWTSVKVTVNGEDVTGKIRLNGVASSYVMVYDPPQNLPFDSTIPVTIDACDLAGNCMNKVTYSFKTAAPDTAPPQISGLVVTTRPTGAKLTWTTNEPANSRVDYGPTNDYELGNVSDGAFVTSHTINLTGLEPNKVYHYKVTSADEQGNTGKTSDLTFKTPDYGDLVSDDFNECALDPSVWEFINPLNDATIQMNGETLQLMVPGGVAHDWKAGKKPPRVMQIAPNGDFTVDVKFNSYTNLQTQSQGVLVEETDGTFFYVSYEYVTDPADSLAKLFMYANFYKDGVKVKTASKAMPADYTNAPLFMRVQRTGDSWRWFYSNNGTTFTAANAAYIFAMAPYKIGFFAGNSGPAGGSPPAQAAILDYFFNKDKPIVPEDGKPIGINLTKNGNGAVTKDPDLPAYLCGAQVTIKATPAAGWTFSGWTGDFTNPNATAVVTVNGQMQVAGNFEAIPLNLTVNINNNGTDGTQNKVQKNPDKATYVYDDEVTLTAVPQPGWSFVQWNGAVVGADLVKTLTMRKDEMVTATFKQDQYTLNLQVINDGFGAGGTATVTPKKTTYVYGDVVSLTATPADHWKFAGWTGDVESTDPTIEYTVTGNTNIQAKFVQDTFDLKVTIINGGVGQGGVVTLNPDKPKYVYGEVVALIADPNCGWTFTEWGGALSGSKPVEVLTITDNTAVTATFTQEKYQLDVTIDGPGNVKIQPKKDDYVCGDVVTLEAVPAPNNFFTGWSGDLTGAQNPVEITIEGDTAITASFSDNQPPVVQPIGDKNVRVNQKLSFTVTATDPTGGEKITLLADGLPEGATFKDNGNGTGAFNWSPGIADAGQYTVTFIASDGKGQGSATVIITVGGNPVVIPVIVGP